MKDILELVVKNLVDSPNEVSITEKTDEKIISYEIRVAKDDMGKIIGKQGRMAKAIRTMIKGISSKEHKRVNIEFAE